MAITFTVNNKPAHVDAGPDTPLLWVDAVEKSPFKGHFSWL